MKKYEEMLQKMRNTAALKELPLIRLEKEFLKIQYPHLMKGATYSGTVLLYRPSDKKYDRALTMVCDTAMVQLIPGNLLHKGKYIVKLDWVINDKSYYLEKEIFAE